MIEAEVEVPQTGDLTHENNSKGAPGEKKMKFWSFLQRERVGQELLLTRESVLQAAHEIGCNRDYIYQMLYRFEADGKICRKVEKNKGTTVTFLSQKKDPWYKRPSINRKSAENNKKFSGTTTFAEAVAALDIEITDLEKKIGEKKTLRAQLLAMIGKEK